MKTSRWTIMMIGFMAILLAGTSAWADGKRGKRDYKGKGYHSSQQHGGGSHYKKPHQGGYVGPHHKKPYHHEHGHGYAHKPHRRPYQHRHHHRSYHHDHHHRYAETGGGYLFSASILDPGFVLSFATGERW